MPSTCLLDIGTFGIVKQEVSQRGTLLKKLFFSFNFDVHLMMFYNKIVKSIGTMFYV